MGLEHLALGFATALTPENVIACAAGVFLGTLIGVLPGLGPVTTIALLLPFTFSLTPTGAIIMLAGIFYGAQYGGSITAILVNMPGEASSTVTCLDGHAMARQGRAGTALAVAAIGSFVGGTIGTLFLAALAAPLAAFAARIEAADYASLMLCGLAAAIVIARGSVLKAIAMTAAGLMLGMVGTDVSTGQARFTLGIPELVDGIGFMPLAIGMFGLAEIIATLAAPAVQPITTAALDAGRPDAAEARRATAASLRGTAIGSLLGVLPGAGPVIASFASYAMEKKLRSSPPALGSGAIEGVAGPESANNAAAQTSFVPLLTLGLPSGPVGALLLGALIVHGIQPGPAVLTREPTLFWGLVASMWIGNVMLLVLNLPLVGWWARLVRVPYRYLYPTTVALSCTGIYALNHSTLDLILAAWFGIAGFLLRARGFEPAPLLLGFVLSQPLRDNFNRALVFSNGDLTTFVTHPLSAVLLAVAAAALLITLVPIVRQTRASLEGGPS
jgi:putative tricarboxylic transport membrane protein